MNRNQIIAFWKVTLFSQRKFPHFVKKMFVISLGYFRSPMADYLPELLPKESEKAHFQIVLPLKWTNRYCKTFHIFESSIPNPFYAF